MIDRKIKYGFWGANFDNEIFFDCPKNLVGLKIHCFFDCETAKDNALIISKRYFVNRNLKIDEKKDERLVALKSNKLLASLKAEFEKIYIPIETKKFFIEEFGTINGNETIDERLSNIKKFVTQTMDIPLTEDEECLLGLVMYNARSLASEYLVLKKRSFLDSWKLKRDYESLNPIMFISKYSNECAEIEKQFDLKNTRIKRKESLVNLTHKEDNSKTK
jgi:hypothetical protein